MDVMKRCRVPHPSATTSRHRVVNLRGIFALGLTLAGTSCSDRIWPGIWKIIRIFRSEFGTGMASIWITLVRERCSEGDIFWRMINRFADEIWRGMKWSNNDQCYEDQLFCPDWPMQLSTSPAEIHFLSMDLQCCTLGMNLLSRMPKFKDYNSYLSRTALLTGGFKFYFWHPMVV